MWNKISIAYRVSREASVERLAYRGRGLIYQARKTRVGFIRSLQKSNTLSEKVFDFELWFFGFNLNFLS